MRIGQAFIGGHTLAKRCLASIKWEEPTPCCASDNTYYVAGGFASKMVIITVSDRSASKINFLIR